MNCPHCQTANPDDARFCAHCGHNLRQACPNCSTEHPLSAKFCTSCGERLAALEAPSSTAQQLLFKYIPKELLAKLEHARRGKSMAGERRIVTMLFCDVKGSTAAAEQMDPEDWAEIMNGAFEHLIAPVYRYEGTLARLMGDAVLGFFGAPIAHEDDPERAVLAGLDIVEGIGPYRQQVREQWNLDFNVRVGVNTGLVVVGEVGSDLRVEYTAMGDAVNLAARMEQTAQPGTVQISEETHKRVAPLFEFEPLGPVEVKGKAVPVATYRVLRRTTQPRSLRGIEGLAAALVGRQDEMTRLRAVVASLLDGSGGIVCLIGEAGLGKSRLISELRSELAGQPHLWCESRGISYETTRPYGQFQQQLRSLAEIADGDSPTEAVAKLGRVASELSDQERESAVQVLRAFFETDTHANGAGLEGEEFKTKFFQANLAIWRGEADHKPLVMVFDDLHWADSSSVELLRHLFQLTDWVPLLLFCAFRSDRTAPGWQVKQAAEAEYPHRYTEISLGPLNEQGSRELVDQLLSLSELPAKVHELIQRRAEGNPFFVEEVVRELIDKGMLVHGEDGTGWTASREIDELDIPDNLQSLLNARIDRLDGAVRRTLQLASVIGRSFYYRVLQAISELVGELERHLSVLQRVELIWEAAREPELEYAFRHALTQEAAYRSILRKERRAYHLQVAETLEQLYPDRLAEFAPVLAHHYQEARDPRGTQYAVMAADSAYRLYAVREAIGLYRQALAADPSDLEIRGHIYTRLGRSYELTDQFEAALQVYEEMRSVASEHSAGELELTALTESAKIHSIPSPMFDPEKGRDFSDRAVQLAQRLQNPEAEARILWGRMNSELYNGEVLRGVEYGRRSLEVAEQYDLREQLAYTLNDLGRVELMVGQTKRARTYIERSRKLWNEFENLPMLADNYAGGSVAAYWVADYDLAIAEADESYRIAGYIENPWGQASGRIWIGLSYLELARFESAIEVLEDGLQLGESAGAPLAVLMAGASQALTLACIGDLSTAFAAIQRAMAVDQTRFASQFPIARAVLARLQVRSGAIADARQSSDASYGRFNERLINIPHHVLVADAEVAFAEDRFEQAAATCDRLLELLQTVDSRAMVPEALLLKGKALLAQKQHGPAGEVLEQASRTARESGSARILWQALLAQARWSEKVGEENRASEWREQARTAVIAVLDRFSNPARKDSFEAMADVQQALDG